MRQLGTSFHVDYNGKLIVVTFDWTKITPSKNDFRKEAGRIIVSNGAAKM